MLSEEEIRRIGLAVAKRLQGQRQSIPMSKNALAQKAGISVQSVSFIENGVNSPSLSTLLRICDALGVELETILKESK